MHRKHSDEPKAPAVVPVTFLLQDPQSLTGGDAREIHLMAGKGQDLLDVAMENGINIEHACGGVCACSTCHVYINEGMKSLSEAQDDEMDRVEEAPALRRTSRLACQSVIQGAGPIVVEVPSWNRNAVKEKPH
ncbi:MAG: 2Fe-2S iron-sulfur cluster-binding protein [Planctomycetota bacterium]|nr:2Fe-2S iron-sulfur cluster-binding protein [Planctomycetota bacterium]